MSVYTEELQLKLKDQLESCVNVSEKRIHTLISAYKKNKDEIQLSEIALRKAIDETKRLTILLRENEVSTETETTPKKQRTHSQLLKENLKNAEASCKSQEIKIAALKKERERIRKELTTSSQLLTDLLLVPRLHLTNINVKPGQPIIRQYDLIKYNKNLQTLKDSAKNLLIDEKDELQKPYALYIKTLREVSGAVAVSESINIQRPPRQPISLTEGIQQRVNQIQQGINAIIDSPRQNDKNSNSIKDLPKKISPIKGKPKNRSNNNNTNAGAGLGNLSSANDTEQASKNELQHRLRAAKAAGTPRNQSKSSAKLKPKDKKSKHESPKTKNAQTQTDKIQGDSDSKYRSEVNVLRLLAYNTHLTEENANLRTAVVTLSNDLKNKAGDGLSANDKAKLLNENILLAKQLEELQKGLQIKSQEAIHRDKRIEEENKKLKLQLEKMQKEKDLEIANLKQRLAALESQSKQDKIELKSKDEAIHNLNQINAQQQQKIQILDKEKKSAYELIDSTVLDFETELQNALKQIETMHQDLNQSIDIAEQYLLRAEHAEQESRNLQQNILTLNEQLSNLHQTTSDELNRTQDTLNSRIHILERQNTDLEKTLHQSQNELRTMALEHEKLKLEYKTLNEKYITASDELAKLQAERDRLLLIIKQLTKERNDALALVAARDLTINDLTRERNDALALVAARDLTINDLTRERNDALALVAARDLTINDLTRERNDALALVAARDLTINDLTRERNDALALVAARDLTINDLTRERNDALALVAARDLTINDLTRERDDARRARVVAVEELAQLRLQFEAKSLEYAQANNALQYERVVHQNQANELNSIITHLRQSTRPGKSY